MLQKIFEKSLQATNHQEELFVDVERKKHLLQPEKEKTQKAFLVDRLIALTQESKLTWGISEDKRLLVCGSEDRYVIVQKIYDVTKYSYRYALIGLGNNKEVIREEDDIEKKYSDHSHRRPIMDLYDIVVDGEFRKVPLTHVCGLQGFGQHSSDSCPACEENKVV